MTAKAARKLSKRNIPEIIEMVSTLKEVRDSAHKGEFKMTAQLYYIKNIKTLQKLGYKVSKPKSKTNEYVIVEVKW